MAGKKEAAPSEKKKPAGIWDWINKWKVHLGAIVGIIVLINQFSAEVKKLVSPFLDERSYVLYVLDKSLAMSNNFPDGGPSYRQATESALLENIRAEASTGIIQSGLRTFGGICTAEDNSRLAVDFGEGLDKFEEALSRPLVEEANLSAALVGMVKDFESKMWRRSPDAVSQVIVSTAGLFCETPTSTIISTITARLKAVGIDSIQFRVIGLNLENVQGLNAIVRSLKGGLLVSVEKEEQLRDAIQLQMPNTALALIPDWQAALQLYGDGEPDRAYPLLLNLANRGFAKPMYYLGLMLKKEKPAEAVTWFEKAWQVDSSSAAASALALGAMYRDANGVAQDMEKSAQWFARGGR